MDYEKKYNEALKWMRELYPGLHDATKEDAKHYFPELRKSEDERMAEMAIKAVLSPEAQSCIRSWEVNPDDVIAWLEKQKGQKLFGGIYWHAIKKGERLPCRAYIWNPDYEKYSDCWDGRLIPNLENICVGADTWYLPAKDVRDLPREGVDEVVDNGNATIVRRKDDNDKPYEPKFKPGIKNVLNSLRPSWKPSKEQMNALNFAITYMFSTKANPTVLRDLYEQLKKLM